MLPRGWFKLDFQCVNTYVCSVCQTHTHAHTRTCKHTYTYIRTHPAGKKLDAPPCRKRQNKPELLRLRLFIHKATEQAEWDWTVRHRDPPTARSLPATKTEEVSVRETLGLGQAGLYMKGWCTSITEKIACSEAPVRRAIREAELKREAEMRQERICCSAAVWQHRGVSETLTA